MTWPSAPRSILLRYGAALAVSLAFVGARAVLEPIEHGYSPFQLLTLAVLLSACWGGMGPGLLATALCAVAGQMLFAGTPGHFVITGLADAVRFATFVLVSSAVSVTSDALLRTMRRIQEQREALRTSEAHWRSLFENAAVGIAQVGLDGRWIEVNETLCGIVGYSREELLARTFQDITHPADLDADLALVKKLLAGEIATYSMEKRYLRTGGAIVWVELTVGLSRDAAGRPLHFVSIVEDIGERKRAATELRVTTDRFEAALKSTQIAVFNQDLELRYTWVHNPWLGYSVEQLLGKRDADLAECHGDAAAIDGLKHEVITTGTGQRHEVTIHLAGVAHFFDLIVEPQRDEAGSLIGVTCAAVDITAGKRADAALRQSEERLRLALNAAEAGVFDLDLATERVDVSAGVLHLCGFEAGDRPMVADYLGRVHDEDRPRVTDAMDESIATATRFYIEFRLVRPGGDERWLAVRAEPVADTGGRVARLIGTVLDVSERNEATRRLAAARDSAEAANQAKDAFLAALSHELRTPLTPVLFVAAAMERSPELAASLRKDFTMIRKNIELEARLIDDLLDLTRITRGKLHLNLEPVDAHAVIEHSWEMLRGDAEARHLAVEFHLAAPEHQLHADAVRLQQVFWNVLKNAVKFTPDHGSVFVRTSNQPGSTLHIEIADTGIGITAEELPRIFDAFAQGKEASSHRFGGLGLGLAISALLVRDHGGGLRAESAGRGHGATFHIEFPLGAVTASAEAVRTPTEPPRDTGRRILLVEDHEPTRHTLTRLLGRRGYVVAAAENAARARELAAGGSFDLMVSDLGLPDGSGYDLVVDLRRDYGIKAIALSGFGMQEDVQRSMHVGFLEHITKPVDIQALYDAIHRATEAGTGREGMKDEG